MRLFLLLFASATMILGCHPRISPQIPDLSAGDVLERICNPATTPGQLQGSFKLRGAGFKKVLGSVDIDIIVQKPNLFYLSIASFFKQPARVITYDGNRLYGISKEELDDFLSLPIEPNELTEILLRTCSLKTSQIRSLDITDNQIKIEKRSGHQLIFEIDPTRFEILKRTLRDTHGNLLYAVTYTKFPNLFDLEGNHQGKHHDMTLRSSDVQLDKGNYHEELFRR